MEFRKATHSAWRVLKKGIKYFLITASLAMIYYCVFSLAVSTDTERRLKRQNKMYSQAYGDMVEKEKLLGEVIEGLKVKDNEIYRALFNSDAPGDQSSLLPSMYLANPDSIPDKDLVIYASGKLDGIEASAEKVEDNFERIMAMLADSEGKLPPLTNPISSFSSSKAGASVGQKINPFYKVSAYHAGLDLISSQGEPVYASAAGTVESVQHSMKGLGNVVTINHGNGFITRYAHLENTRVSRGQKVEKGKQIGSVGISGNSFAPHLHYEVLRDTTVMDPLNYFFASLTPDEYVRMLFMSANTGQSMD